MLVIKPTSSWSKSQTLLRNILITTSSILIFLSFSKTAIITYFLISTLTLFASAWKKKCVPCLLSNIIVTTILVTVFLQAKADPYSLEKRVLLFQQSLSIISHTWLTGVGFGQYLFSQSSFPTPYPYFFLQPVHNIFLLFIMQAGIIFSCILAFMSRNWFMKILKVHNIWVIFFVLVLTGMADHYWLTLHQNMLLMGVVFGYLHTKR
jgi:hypothetical protein